MSLKFSNDSTNLPKNFGSFHCYKIIKNNSFESIEYKIQLINSESNKDELRGLNIFSILVSIRKTVSEINSEISEEHEIFKDIIRIEKSFYDIKKETIPKTTRYILGECLGEKINNIIDKDMEENHKETLVKSNKDESLSDSIDL